MTSKRTFTFTFTVTCTWTVMVFGLSGCTQFENAMASIPVFSFLRNSPALDPYEAPRPAPYGSVPYGTPAGESLGPLEATQAGLNEFAAQITNPFAPADSVALRVGQTMYMRHCAVCHGPQGKGDGSIIGQGKFPFAPNLTLPVTRAHSDGYLYAIIRAGRGLMPAYGPRTNHLERWAIVMYVRQLQGATPAPATAPATTGQ
ncbi:MAG: c-type cytochrome [Gemmatimonadota bacterium]